MSKEKNSREYSDYYTDLMIEIDKAAEKVAIDEENNRNEAVNSIFNYLLEIPNRVLADHSITTEDKVAVVNDVLDGVAQAININADACEKIGENTEQDELELKRAIVFEKLANKLAQSIQQDEMPDVWQGYEDKLRAIIVSTKIEEPAKEELAQDVFVLQDIAEENFRELDDHSFDTIRTSSFSAADRDVDLITKAIRDQILTKQRELIVEALVKNSIAKPEEIEYLTKFRAYCENEENKEKISEVLRGAELKRALEQVEIVGYKNVHTQFSSNFSTMEWKDGVGESGNGITTKTQIVRDASNHEIATLTEATHQINPPQTVQKSDGTTVEVKNYRTIDFPIELKDGGPMHLSLAVKDQHGRNIAASKAVYFTAHYDDNGRLIEVSSPHPVKFNGTDPDAVGYIEHGGQIYTLPVTQEKYKAMMQEVAQNKGHGVNISQSVDILSVDRIITSPQKTEELGKIQEAMTFSPHKFESEEVGLEPKAPEVNLTQFSSVSTINEDDIVHTPNNPVMPKPYEEPDLMQFPSVSTIHEDDMVRTASKPVKSEKFERDIGEAVNSLKKSLLKSRSLPTRKTDTEITAQAENIYKNLQGQELKEQKQYINEELKKSSTPQEQIKLLQELARVEADKRGERVKDIGLGGEREANVGPVTVITEQRIESANGTPQMERRRKREDINVKDEVNLQAFLKNRVGEIKQESQNPARTFRTQKVGSHSFP